IISLVYLGPKDKFLVFLYLYMSQLSCTIFLNRHSRGIFVKKVIWLFTISLLLVACSGGNSDEENNGINVEKGKNQVEITLPADIIEAEEKDMDEIIADAEENGIDEVVKNQ